MSSYSYSKLKNYQGEQNNAVTSCQKPTNVSKISEQIKHKNDYSKPYFATKSTAKNIETNFDVFPYYRFWDGEYNSSKPRVNNRQAGWRPRVDNLYYGKRQNNNLEYNLAHSYEHNFMNKKDSGSVNSKQNFTPIKGNVSSPNLIFHSGCNTTIPPYKNYSNLVNNF